MLAQETSRMESPDLVLPDVSDLIIDSPLYSRNLSAGSSDVYDRLDLRSDNPKVSKELETPKVFSAQNGDAWTSNGLMSGGAGDGRRGKADASRSGSSSSEAAHGSSTQRPTAQANQSRRQQGRSTFSPPTNYYPPAPPEGFQISNVPPSQQPQSTPQYTTSHGTYTQRSGYVGQYTIPGQPPTSLLPSPHQYSYSNQYHVPSLHSSESNVSPTYPGMNYPSQPLAQSLQGRGPVYQYQRFQEGPASSPQFTGHSNTPVSPAGYDPSPPSHSPHSPTPPSGPPSAHYPGIAPSASYTSLHYATLTPTPQYAAYGTESYAPNNPSMYTSQYGTSYPQYRVTSSPEDSRGQQGGTWWYIPPNSSPGGGPNPYDNSHSPFQGQPYMNYAPGPVGHSGVDQYNNPALSSYPSSPSQSYQIPRPAPKSLFTRSESPSASGSVAEGSSLSAFSPGAADTSVPSKPGGDGPPTVSSSRARRSFHPHVAPNRSDWVMWVGNVPSDASHNELWTFFNQPPQSPSTSSSSSSSNIANAEYSQIWDGVSSIFLISRSNCAFVNFESEAHLQHAVARFNGQPLRSNDPRCPRLVCRVRRKDDDLRAGVGGQRGMGMHHRWVKEQREKAEKEFENVSRTPSDTGEQSESTSSSSARSPLGESEAQQSGLPHLSPTHHSSSSGTTTSTNSSFLRTYFPKRFFILKSLSEADLQISVERGLWATQQHNEDTLNQAYRNSQDVFLIFGANKSGEFFGYARMAGPIAKSEDRVPWTPRRHTHSPTTSISSIDRGSLLSEVIPEDSEVIVGSQGRHRHILSPHRLTDDSPGPVTAAEALTLQRASRDPSKSSTPASAHDFAPGFTPRVQPPTIPASAPAEPYQPHRKITFDQDIRLSGTVDGPPNPRRALLTRPLQNFTLDPTKVIEARERRASGSSDENDSKGKERVRKPEDIRRVTEPALQTDRAIGEEGEEIGADERGEESWGTAFKVQWMRTTRLPFHRTRHIRNPWNHDREVKVSRDGTEIEPSAGQVLLDEWDKPELSSSTGGTAGSSGRRGAGARPQSKTGPSGSALPLQRAPQGGSASPGDGGGRT